MYNGFFPTDLGKTQSVYRVTLDPDEIYCLGPFTQVLSAVSQDTFVIAVETSNKEEVLRTIHSKGQNKLNLYQASAFVWKKLYSLWFNGRFSYSCKAFRFTQKSNTMLASEVLFVFS